MLGFDWTPIRERDADGRLVAAGLQWTEKREAAFVALLLMGMFALFGGLAALIANVSGLGWTLLGVFLVMWMTARFSKGQTRALTFHRDGRTSAPHGFVHYNSKFREVTGTNANFVSIEARDHHGRDSDVVGFTRGGDVVYIGGRLHRDSAHKVAVQLTLALAELRESLGKETKGGGSGTRARAAAIID